MKATLLIAIITAAVAGTVQAQINVGANVINGVNASVYSGSANTNDGTSSAIGGAGNYIRTNSSGVIIGGGSSHVAGGLSATISGGFDHFNTNNFATIGGGIGNKIGPSANGATIPGGAYAVADHFGQFAYSSQKFSVAGDSQSSLYVLRVTTTSATTTELSLVGTGYTSQMTLGSGAVWSFHALVTGKDNNNNTGAYEIKGLIKNIGGTTTLVGATTTVLGEDVGAWDANAGLDQTTDALLINVTGTAGNTINWTAAVHTSELN